MKSLLKIFIFFAPFTVYFAVSAWLRFPVMLILFLLIFSVLYFIKRKSINLKFIAPEDIFLIALLFLVLISLMFNFYGQRAFNHTLAYFFSIGLYYFFVKLLIVNTNLKVIEFVKVMYSSFITISIILILDTIGKNFNIISLRELFVPNNPSISNVKYFIRVGFFNTSGVAEEPGVMALFYNIYFCGALIYAHLMNKNLIILISLLLLNQFLMFSAAGIFLPILSLLIVGNYQLLKNEKYVTFLLFFYFIIILFIGIYWNKSKIILENVFDKLFFNENNPGSSSGARLNQWKRALNNFIESPLIGKGPGYGIQENSEGYLSIYLTILADIGILAFICFLLYLIALFLKIYQLRNFYSKILMYGFIIVALHIFIVSDFYQAPIWIFFILIQLIYNESKPKRNFI